MKVTDLQVFWAFVVIVILSYVMPFVVLKYISTFGGGFTYFAVVPAAGIIYAAIYIAKRWKEVLK